MSKPMKTIIIKGAKPRKYDLSFSKPSENMKILAAIESLKQNQGWYLLVQVLEKERSTIDANIISKKDVDNKPLTDAEVDLLRMNRNYLDELIRMPDKITSELSREEVPAYDGDPYDKEIKQVR